MSTLRFRRPTEADHAQVVDVVDEWWGGRKMRALLPRLWFRHFSILLGGFRAVFCAKLHHHSSARCIFNCRFHELKAEG